LADRHQRWVRDAMAAICASDECVGRGRRSRVVLAPRRWRQVGGDDPPAMVTRKPDHQREHEGNRNTIAQGMPVQWQYLW